MRLNLQVQPNFLQNNKLWQVASLRLELMIYKYGTCPVKMRTLRSQQSKSTRSSSRRCEKFFPLKTAAAARIKTKKQSLAVKFKSSSTAICNPITEDGKFMCKAPGCNFTSKYKFCLKRHNDCHCNPNVSSQRSKSTEFTARGKFKCNNKSSYATAQSGNLMRHLTNHPKAQPFARNIDTLPFACHYCEYRSRWNQNVKAHEKWKHSGMPSPASGQKKMGEVTVREAVKTPNLEQDQKSNHQLDTLQISSANNRATPEGSFQCKDCDYLSKSKHLLISHMEERHSGEKAFPCTFPGCSYRSKCFQWARAHERRAHSFTRSQYFEQLKPTAQKQTTRASKILKSPDVQIGKRVQRPPIKTIPIRVGSATATPTKKICTRASKEKVQCPQCEHKCYQRFLQHHLKVHSNDKPFICSVKGCNYRTRWPADLKTHRKTHEKLSKISPASALFSRKSSSRRRKTSSKAIVPTVVVVKQFKCPDCDYHGKTSWHVNRHRQTHGNIPPIRCPVYRCRFRTRDERNLVKHRLESHSKGQLSRPIFRPNLKPKAIQKGCRFCGCTKKSHAMKNVKGRRGWKQPLVVDQAEPEMDRELNMVNVDEEEEGKGNIEEVSMEPVVELADSTGFACMLCDFVGYSERAALDHAKCHTQPVFPMDQLNEIPVICLD